MRRRQRHYDDFGWPPYVPVADRRLAAEREAAARRKRGETLNPVVISGRTLATTFWGKAWCSNLERYRDYDNRLPRGRAYVRNGAVIDLRLERGKVLASVMGTSLYRVEVVITPLAAGRWDALVGECAGKIASAMELLQGKLSKAVMEIITRAGGGLFPEPREIHFRCSCPDYASMCKHVAASLYGVGARLDHQPELLFLLRGVDPAEMVGRAGVDAILAGTAPKAASKLEEADLAGLFGIELDAAPPSGPKEPPALQPRAVKPAGEQAALKPRTVERRPPAPPRKTATPVRSAPTKPEPDRPGKPGRRESPAISGGKPTNRTTGRPKTPSVIVTAKDLTGQGVPHAVIQQWLRKGVLRRTSTRGAYLKSPLLASALKRYLASGKA